MKKKKKSKLSELKSRTKAKKSKALRTSKKPTEAYHKRSGVVTERDLTGDLNEELQEAWEKIRAFGASLGDQRIYASHNSIMFSKKICYFFVRPRKSFLEVWIFLPRKIEGLKAMRGTKKLEKYCNLFKLIHADQVEEPLTDWIREAYDFTPSILYSVRTSQKNQQTRSMLRVIKTMVAMDFYRAAHLAALPDPCSPPS